MGEKNSVIVIIIGVGVQFAPITYVSAKILGGPANVLWRALHSISDVLIEGR